MGSRPKDHVAAQAAPSGGWRQNAHGFAEKFERVANAAAAPLPSPRIRLWLAGFFHPEETYEKVGKDATLAGLAGNLILFYIAYSLIFFLFMLLLSSGLSQEDLLSIGLQKNPDIAKIAVGSLVLGPIASTAFALAVFAMVFIGARILGGKGTYVKQANSMALVLCGSNTLLLALMCIAFVIFLPSFILRDYAFLGTIVSIAGLLANVPVLALCVAILLYTMYAHYLVVRKSHGLSAARAVAAIVIAVALVLLSDVAISAILGS